MTQSSREDHSPSPWKPGGHHGPPEDRGNPVCVSVKPMIKASSPGEWLRGDRTCIGPELTVEGREEPGRRPGAGVFLAQPSNEETSGADAPLR